MQITFNVRASEYVALEELRPFQGELKKLSEENHNKLRTEIIEDGFNFAAHVWLCDGKHYILDGHQRIYTLKQLAKEGYQFCKPNGDLLDGVPVNIVHATDINNAKRKVLQAVSQYGKLDDQGFKDFTIDVDFDMAGFDFPDFVLPDMKSPDFEFKDDGEKDENAQSFKLIIELENIDQQQDLFDEIKGRGFKVKASE